MPMDFPDLNSLKREAEMFKFRKPNDGETESEYRTAVADHVAKFDFIESEEVRNGCGWDRFSKDQNIAMLRRSGIDFVRRQYMNDMPKTKGEKHER